MYNLLIFVFLAVLAGSPACQGSQPSLSLPALCSQGGKKYRGAAYTSAPVWIGEFGTGNGTSDLASSGAGSQGQWFTDLINFIKSSYGSGGSGISVSNLDWTYWALNGEDSFALLNGSYNGLANPTKEYSYLCFVQTGPLAVPPGSGSGQCGSTGALPAPQ